MTPSGVKQGGEVQTAFAGIEDFAVAVATYDAARKRWPEAKVTLPRAREWFTRAGTNKEPRRSGARIYEDATHLDTPTAAKQMALVLTIVARYGLLTVRVSVGARPVQANPC